MIQEELFNKIKTEVEQKLTILADKPEETVESTLKALWLKAAGISKSSEEALKAELPVLSKDQLLTLDKLIEQRLNNIPLAYITERQNFMGIEMLCDSRALIPRKETEILGNAALDICKNIVKTKNNPLVLDLCCGSGNLGIALAILEPASEVFLSDLSQEAIDLTKDNLKWLSLPNRVTAMQGNMFEAFKSEKFQEKFDLIVCNPPYISSAKVSKMNPEVIKNEPHLAFDGGLFGTTVIQQLLNEAPAYLKKRGYLLFEVGLQQGQFYYTLCVRNQKYSTISIVTDSLDNIRVIQCVV